MKTKLTPEQSQRLIELGVDPSNASDFEHLDPYGLDDTIPTGVPIFTLSDILLLLPKRISKNDACLTIIADYNDWWVGYEYDSALSGKIDSVAGYTAPELIDALFELLVWCITNKHLKL